MISQNILNLVDTAMVSRLDDSNAALAAVGLAVQGLEGVHTIDQINGTSASLAYGATDKITLGVRVPRVARDNIRESELEGSAFWFLLLQCISNCLASGTSVLSSDVR